MLYKVGLGGLYGRVVYKVGCYIGRCGVVYRV